MKYLIYGAGVIGSIFALKLAKSGHDVTMLARGKRVEDLKQNGVVLFDMFQKEQEQEKVHVVETLKPNDQYDYILVTLQKTQVDAVLPMLQANCSENIVFVVNNALGYEKWANILGEKRVMIGFPSAGGEKVDGVIRYFIGRGIVRMFQTTTFGEYHQVKTKRVQRIVKDFKDAKIPSVYSSDMNVWQKYHVGIVTSIANILYKYDGDNYALAKSSKDIKLMLRGIKEAFKVLKKLGYKVTPFKLNYFKLPLPILLVIFKPVMGRELSEITMSKHAMNAVDEMRCLQEEFDVLIEKSGLDTPSIDQLRTYLVDYQK